MTKTLRPGQTIGIVGGGQLGRMLALAAAELGLKAHIYAETSATPAAEVAAASTVGAYDDTAQLARFAAAVDCITYEFENIPAAGLAEMQAALPVLPPATALAVSQDRFDEKTFIRAQGLAVADFIAIDSGKDLADGLAQLGGEGILKTRRFGYDGKGQWRLTGDSDLAKIALELDDRPAIIEAVVPFEREISVLVARNTHGDMALYEPVENVHKNHILHSSTVPAHLSSGHLKKARTLAETLANALDYVGVLAIETFVTGDDLVVNEIAPRVHNSGHLTADACLCGQFEQHIRAVAGWPLGDTKRHSNAVMINLLGDDVADWQTLAAKPGSRLHLYGKAEARPGRKMGHVTYLSEKTDAAPSR